MKIKSLIIFIIICLVGFAVRIFGIDWDQGFHLHPDERFLTMVSTSVKIPSTLSQYFNPTTSLLYPPNVGMTYYVYGILPITILKLLSIAFNMDTYNYATILGRFLSALVDTGTIFFIYKIASLLKKKQQWHELFPHLVSLIYALSVLPIQLSHFFAVDTFLTFFTFGSFYFVFHFSYFKRKKYMVFSAIFFGLGMACKITALFIFPLILVFLLVGLLPQNISFSMKRLLHLRFMSIVPLVFIYTLISYTSVRLADPYIFQYSNPLNLTINKIFIQNLQTLNAQYSPGTTFPPAIQYIHSLPIIFSLKNIIFFGLGLPAFIFFCYGVFVLFKKMRENDLTLIFFWMTCFFIYQSCTFIKVMRYFVLLYPFFALFTGIGVYFILRRLRPVYYIIIFILLLIWPLSFLSIYTQEHSRVEASEWIYKHIPNGSVLLGELWDDPLPLLVQHTYKKHFDIQQMPVFDVDSNLKWQKMNLLLQKGNYIILSSNRAWASIPTVPEMYPRTTRFYSDLFAGKLAYKKVKEFTVYPSLSFIGIPLSFPDDWADEAFTVFDHPLVIIFQKHGTI